ncbi:MAG: shikimate kinase [Candidatus Limnocylindrales bacterium]
MPDHSLPTLVLLGMMGSGKSTVGRELASRTGWRYMDNDELVHAVTGRAPEEIDASEGEDALHEAEAEALRHALSVPPPLIAGAAAWVVTDPASVERLRRAPAVVYLRARPETLRARIGAGEGRRDDATDLAWLRARHAERDEIYRGLASVTVDTDALDPETVADRIIEALTG